NALPNDLMNSCHGTSYSPINKRQYGAPLTLTLIVTSMRTNSDYGIPTLNGAALLTGINDDALKQQIKALLTQ
ncbi:hypothetical protein ACH0C5_26305, partial [Escherichia coli]